MLPPPRRVLHLVIAGVPAATLGELAPAPGENVLTETLTLSEANAREALEKIFAADAVTVLGPL